MDCRLAIPDDISLLGMGSDLACNPCMSTFEPAMPKRRRR